MNADARRSWIALLLGVLLTVPGCVSTSAPDAWESSSEEMQRTAYGAWVDVQYGDAAAPDTVQGELLAATTDSLFVLPLDGPFRAVARPTINELQLTAYDANWGYLGAWTTLGALSTASHGGFLILSFPVWVIGGSAAASAQSRRPVYTNPPLDTLRRFARFPQGLPPGVARDQLRSKPFR